MGSSSNGNRNLKRKGIYVKALKSMALLLLATVVFGNTSPMTAKSIEPNGRARLLVKRDLRLFALEYEELMGLVKDHKVLVDLMMISAPTPGQPADLGFNKAHQLEAGTTVGQALDEINRRFSGVVRPEHVVEVFKSTEVCLVRLSQMKPELKNYVLEPGDIVMVRTVSDI